VSQLAVGFKNGMSSGREQRTDGLWKHLGIVDGGSLRATNNLTPNAPTGAGLELLYDRPSLTSYVLSFDRDVNAYRDLNIVGHNINLQPAGGGVLTMPAGSINTATIAANAVQQQLGSYLSAVSWSTSVLNAWVATAVSLQATTAGGLLRLEASMPLFHSLGGAGFYVGWMLDGSIQNAMAYYISPGINYTVNFGMTWYATPAAGLHTFALAVYSTNAGALSINAAAVATLYVTEQKR
jgi:hypothetical protein